MLGDELKEHRGMLGLAGPLYPADIVDKTVAKLQQELLRYKIKFCMREATICHSLSAVYGMEMVAVSNDSDRDEEDAMESESNREAARKRWREKSDKHYERSKRWLKMAGKLKNEMR